MLTVAMDDLNLSALPTPPGARGLPLVGESFQFLRDPGGFVDARWDRHGPIFHSHMLGKPTVFMRGAENRKRQCGGQLWRSVEQRFPNPHPRDGDR